MGILAIFGFAMMMLAIGFLAGLLAQHPFRIHSLPGAIRELYPLTENPASDEKNYDQDGKVVVEGITLPSRRCFFTKGSGHYTRCLYLDNVHGWQPAEPGLDYSEVRYRVV